MRGKQAFSFYNRTTGKSIRLVLKKKPENMTREESFAYYQKCEPEEIFDVKPTTIEVPERARLFHSVVCECCGEEAAKHLIRLQDGKSLCLDCVNAYDRFNV